MDGFLAFRTLKYDRIEKLLLCFYHVVQQWEVRKTLWVLSVCIIIGVQVLQPSQAPVMRKFPIIANEWEDASRHIWGKVIVAMVRWDVVLREDIQFRISILVVNVFWWNISLTMSLRLMEYHFNKSFLEITFLKHAPPSLEENVWVIVASYPQHFINLLAGFSAFRFLLW